MNTYSRWKNAHPRDYKIDDAAMLRLLTLVLSSPFLVLAQWCFSLYEAGRMLRRGRTTEALAYALLTPFFTLGEAPGYFRARWLSITE